MSRHWSGFAFLAVVAFALPSFGQVVTPFARRFPPPAAPPVSTQGDILIIGNTLMTCQPSASCTAAQNGSGNNNSFNSQYVDIDSNGTTFNSSSATLTLPADATVLFAGLYWGGRSNDSARNTVLFSTSATGPYQPIAGTVIGTGPSGSDFPYAGFADVTSQVAASKSGVYTTANVRALVGDSDQYAGWALVVVFGSASEPARNLSVFDGFVIVNSTTAPSITVSGFQTPPVGPVNIELGAIAFEGDRNTAGDHFLLNGVQISDPTNPINNFFNSTISDNGVVNTARNPPFTNTLGFDAVVLQVNNTGNSIVPNNATSATLSFDSTGDVYYPTVATFATEVFAPEFTTSKTANVAGANPGDVIEYTVTITNTGQDAATNTILADPIPANTTYVPGSLSVTGGPNSGAKTDAAGDDQAEFNAAQNRVMFRLGTSATAAAGGTLAIGASTTLKFSVRVNPGVPAGTVISNQAGPITATGDVSQIAISSLSDANPALPGDQPTLTPITGIPDLTMTKTHTGTFRQGSTGTYSITVSNAGNAPTAGAVNVSDTLPAGLTATAATGTGWTCTTGPTVACNRSDALAPGASYPPITITVNVAATAPASVTNTATVSGGGDPSPANNTASDPTSITPAADLSIAKSHTGNFTAGQTGTYTIVVSNAAAAGPTTGTVTVTDPVPAGLTVTGASGSGWTCVVGPPVSCTRGDPLAAGASYPPITLTVSVATGAPASVTNTATVSGGGDVTPANDTASDPTSIAPSPDLSIVKSHTGVFTAGQTGTYNIVVSNAAGAGPTTGTVTVTDPVPTGLTVNTATGPGWTCAVGPPVSCTRSDPLAGGASYLPITLTVQIDLNAPASVTNIATVSGGGDNTPSTNNASSDPTSINVIPDLTITKSHTGSFVAGETGTYTITVSNAANVGPTSGAVTVTDSLPAGLTATAAGGFGWSCTTGQTVTCTRSDALAPGNTYPPITLTVAVAANVPASIVNTATVAGGGDVSPANNTASDPTATVPGTDLTIAMSHAGNFTAGQSGATYTIVVSNAANATPSTGIVTVTDPLPAGFTATAAGGDGWNCNTGTTVTCTRNDPLAGGASYPAITLTVNIPVSVPASVTNTATVAGGDDINPGNNLASDPTPLTLVSDLSIAKSHTGNFTAGQSGTYTLVVTNSATAGPTTGTVTVSDTLPAGLTATAATGAGWTCTTGATVSCTRSDALAPGASYPPISLTVSIAANAPASLTNTATVAGGGDATPSSNTASDPTSITLIPDLSILKARNGPLVPGQTGAYAIVVSNAAGAGPTSGAVTVADPLPAGLTATAASGNGWTCTTGATVSCTRSDVLQPGASYPPITLTVNIPSTAPASFTNTATVSGGGDATPNNNAGSDPPSVSAAPDLSLTKTHSGNFIPGQSGTYTLLVSNAASAGPTIGAVTVTDTLPTGLTATAATGAGWNCTTGPTVTCTRSDALAGGASYPPVTLSVTISPGAPGSVTNVANVSGGGDPSTANNTASDPTTIVNVPPDLSMIKVHSGGFAPGQPGTYTLAIHNAATAGPTTAPVTVTDTIPAGLTAVTAAGDGWSCTVGPTVSCTRSDVLQPGNTYPLIAITVSVAANAPSTVTNTASFSGGGDVSPANNSASDTTPIPNGVDLSIAKSHSGAFTAGQTGVYMLVVSNAASAAPTSGAVTVTDAMPTGLTAVSTSGDGWACTLGPTVTCTRSDVLPPGASYPPISLTVQVAANAPATVVNTASVEGGGDLSTGNNSGADSTSIVQPANLTMAKSHTGNLVPGQTATYSLVVSNAANAGPSSGVVTVTDTLPPDLTVTAASGPGWSCVAAGTVVCTRGDALPPGSSYPPVTLTVNVGTGAASTIINSASVDGGGDVTPGDNSGSDSGTPVTPACLSTTAALEPNLGASATGALTVTVANPGTAPSSGRVQAIAALPSFALPIAASGQGWDCGIVGHVVNCARTDVLAPGAQYPPITVSVNLARASADSRGTATFYVSDAPCTRPATIPVVLPRSLDFGPEITLVTNAASFVTPGHTNYGIAPGSLVTIFGRGIGPVTPAFMEALPLNPAGFAGVHVQATVGNTTLDVPAFFAFDRQLNVMLPSQMPLGDGNMTVTFDGRTTPLFPIRVVRTNLGIFAPNRQGYGPGAVQNAFPGGVVVNNTLFEPARPGQIVELWATGLGAVQGNEFAEPLPGSVDVPVVVYAGGQTIAPTYAGRSGCCAGTDQIHFVFPETVQGCYIPVFVKAGGVVSNTITMAVSNDTHCSDPGGLTVTELDRINNGETLVAGTVSLNRTILPTSMNQDYALATFRNLNRPAILATEPDFPLPPVGACTVGQTRTDGQGNAPAAPLYIPADTLSVFPFREKPNGYMTAGAPGLTEENRRISLLPDAFLRYSALMGQPSSTLLDPGQIAVGNDQTTAPLGQFPQSVELPAAPQVTGFPTQNGQAPVIDRNQPLTVQWSGGDPANEQAVISGFKTITSLTGGKQGTTATTWFVCTAPIADGTYTVPADVLQAIPTGLPVTGPSGEQLPWVPGGNLNDVTSRKSSLSIGSVRLPADSRFATPSVDFARLIYILTTRQEVDYR